MKRILLTTAAAAIAFLFATHICLAVTSSTVPLRHLVYSFSRTAGQTTAGYNRTSEQESTHNVSVGRGSQTYVASGDAVPTSGGNGAPPDPGYSHVGGTPTDTYNSAPANTGTISVDVTHEQTDGGLVVVISEKGSASSSPPATCVVYGNTTVICDPAKSLDPEEYTLLRFLGSSFVDLSQIDAQQHWRVAHDSNGVDSQADYTIEHNDNGMLTIGELVSMKPKNGSTTMAVQSTIGYNFAQSLPTSIDEHTTLTQNAGVTGTVAATSHTSLQLVSDSTAPQ